jgi:hypothetical protein
VEEMINKTSSHFDINVYDSLYSRDAILQQLLSDYEEVAWLERGNGFKEGIIKTANIRGLNLENRKLQVSFLKEIKSYIKEKGMSITWFNDNVFLKVTEGVSYEQRFVNPALNDTLAQIYVIGDSHLGSYIKFLNKDLSIPLEKGKLIVFPSSEEYSYLIDGVTSGELLVGICYIDR